MAATGVVTTGHPHVTACATEREVVIELDVPDVDVSRIACRYTRDGSLEIHAPRLRPKLEPLSLIHPEAEAC